MIVNLKIVGVRMSKKAVFGGYIDDICRVQNKQHRSEDWSLRYPVEDGGRFRLDTIVANVLGPTSQIGPEPSKNSAFEAVGELKPVE